MDRLRVVHAVVTSILLIVLLGCGGGNSISNPDTGPGSTVAASADGSGMHAVRMAAQNVELSGPWSGGRDASTTGAAAGIPLPSAITATASAVKQAAYSAGDLIKDGSAYDKALPHNRVSDSTPPSAIFSPVWGNETAPVIDDAAYCIYNFSLAGYAASGGLQTLGLEWGSGYAPADASDLWIGFANRTLDRWEWYAGPQDSVLSLDSFTPYTAGDGSVLVLVCMLGSIDCALEQLLIGVPEVRAMGETGFGGAMVCSPPLEGGMLPHSVDLSPYCSPVNDQGEIASATAFSIGDGAYNYELGQLYGDDGWDFNDAFNLTGPRYLYIETGKDQGLACPDQGRDTNSAGLWLMESGVATEEHAPYGSRDAEQFDCGDSWSADALDDAGLLDIEGWNPVACNSDAGINSVKAVLANQHRVLVVRLNVDAQFLAYAPNEVWTYSGPAIGSHSMCIAGYDNSHHAFKVRNSWSADWGGDGYCWISYDTFKDPDATVRCWWLKDDYNASTAQRFCGQQQAYLPPVNVQASDGTYTDQVQVTWDADASATGYKVYRDLQDNLVATLGNQHSWSDTAIQDYNAHTYWVRAVYSGGESQLSSPDVGFLAQAPVIISVSPLWGEPGQAVVFSAVVQGSAPMTYSWNFGGGATPNTSTSANPQETLGAEGMYNCTLSVENSYGSDTFGFQLLIGDMIEITSFELQAVNATGGSTANGDVFHDGDCATFVANQQATMQLYSVSGRWYGVPFTPDNLPAGVTQAQYEEVKALAAAHLAWNFTNAGRVEARFTGPWFAPDAAYSGQGDPGAGIVCPDDDPESGAGYEEGELGTVLAAGMLGLAGGGNVGVPNTLDYTVASDLTSDADAPVIEGFYTGPDFGGACTELLAGVTVSTVVFLNLSSWAADGSNLPNGPDCSMELVSVSGHDASHLVSALSWDDDGDIDTSPEPGEFYFCHNSILNMNLFICCIPGMWITDSFLYMLRFNDGDKWSTINLPATLLLGHFECSDQDLPCLPDVLDRETTPAFIQIFRVDPMVRRDGRIAIDFFNETANPVDAIGFSDILKSSGDEFSVYLAEILIEGVPTLCAFPTVEVIDSEGHLVPDITIPASGGRGSDRIVVDASMLVLSLPPGVPGGPSDEFDFTLFNYDESEVGSGSFEVPQEPWQFSPVTGVSWGIDVGNRGDWQAASFDSLCINHALDGSTMATPEPDVFWVRLNWNTRLVDWDEYWGDGDAQDDNIRVVFENLENGAMMSTSILPAIIGVSVNNDIIAIHHFNLNDTGYYYDWASSMPSGGILNPGSTYQVILDDPSTGSLDYIFPETMAVIGDNPNLP